MIVQICVGSSCHLKGSSEIIELLKKNIEKYGLSDEVVLTGSLCIGQCNRLGVTLQCDDEIVAGVNTENFNEFFSEHILAKVGK